VTPGLVKDTAPLFHIVHKTQFCTCAWFTKFSVIYILSLAEYKGHITQAQKG